MPGGGAVVVEPLMGRGGGAGMNGNPGWVRGRGRLFVNDSHASDSTSSEMSMGSRVALLAWVELAVRELQGRMAGLIVIVNCAE